jgi:hypothetical protein
MARRKSRLSRLLDPKPRAYAAFRALTAPVPAARHWLGFYPEVRPLPERVESVAEALDYRIRLADPAFAPQLDVLAPDNWDIFRPNITLKDPFVAQRFAGILRDAIVPGHTFTPVDPETRAQIAFGQRGRSNWNVAHPAPTILHRRRIAGPAMVVPPHWNLWHLVLEFLVPLVRAARLRAWGDAPLAILTAKKRPPQIDAVVDGLRRAQKLDLSIVELGPTEHARLDRMLVTVNQCWNSERLYALAEAMPDVKQVFSAAYQDRPHEKTGSRLYITRRGTKLRQIVNEDEVIAGLRSRGFDVIQGQWGNHHDQIAAFARARIVVGVHGAGMSNLIFSEPGTQVLEMFPSDHRKTSMLHLSAEHDLSHRPFFGSKEGFNQAFSVDPARLFATLDPLL